MSDLKTQNPVDVAIAEAGREAQGSVQWLLEKQTCPDAPEITEGNDIQFFICGQKGFGQLSRDLLAAESTVDLICWGFDPGMELERASGPWPRGLRYGEALEDLAKKEKKSGYCFGSIPWVPGCRTACRAIPISQSTQF